MFELFSDEKFKTAHSHTDILFVVVVFLVFVCLVVCGFVVCFFNLK